MNNKQRGKIDAVNEMKKRLKREYTVSHLFL